MATAAELHIEKNIPIPLQRGRGRKYPFADMQVGDSVFLAGVTTAGAHNALAYHKRSDRKFICRAVDGGVRVWRVS